jgi:riboflavin kinase/FMN adenylyltransferase
MNAIKIAVTARTTAPIATTTICFFIGFNGDLYGQRVEVSLLKKIRSEMKFNSFDELSNQIAIDREKALEIADSHRLYQKKELQL